MEKEQFQPSLFSALGIGFSCEKLGLQQLSAFSIMQPFFTHLQKSRRFRSKNLPGKTDNAVNAKVMSVWTTIGMVRYGVNMEKNMTCLHKYRVNATDTEHISLTFQKQRS